MKKQSRIQDWLIENPEYQDKTEKFSVGFSRKKKRSNEPRNNVQNVNAYSHPAPHKLIMTVVSKVQVNTP